MVFDQGIYDKINSEWDPDKTSEYQLFFNDVARFPPIDPRFMANLTRITSLILTTIILLGLSSVVSYISPIPEWEQIAWLGQISGLAIFLSYIFINLFSLNEEKSILTLANFSHKLKRNLFNETMYGEWLLVSQLDINKKHEGMKEWYDSHKEWGTPSIFFGYLYSKVEDIRELTAEEKSFQLRGYQQAEKENNGILPSMRKLVKKNYTILKQRNSDQS